MSNREGRPAIAGAHQRESVLVPKPQQNPGGAHGPGRRRGAPDFKLRNFHRCNLRNEATVRERGVRERPPPLRPPPRVEHDQKARAQSPHPRRTSSPGGRPSAKPSASPCLLAPSSPIRPSRRRKPPPLKSRGSASPRRPPPGPLRKHEARRGARALSGPRAPGRMPPPSIRPAAARAARRKRWTPRVGGGPAPRIHRAGQGPSSQRCPVPGYWR